MMKIMKKRKKLKKINPKIKKNSIWKMKNYKNSNKYDRIKHFTAEE